MSSAERLLNKVVAFGQTHKTVGFIAGGLLFALGTLLQVHQYALAQPTKSVAVVDTDQVYHWPTTITIPTANISVNVIEGGIANGEWILAEDMAHYVQTAGKLGEGYNTIVYAHKRPALFERLHKAQIGDSIWVKDEVNQPFVYQITNKEVIKPEDLAKLKSETPNTLTLSTCDGLADTERLVVKAALI